MARPLRLEFPGALYHITSRGNAQEAIFRDEGDRRAFLSLLASVIKRFRWLCHAYCLMEDHYHLLIETPEGNLSRGMGHLNGVYTQAFNRRHDREGHLFQGRFKAILVERESYLLELCRHVVLNPVRAQLVLRPERWAWSSYGATAGLRRSPELLSTGWVLSRFSSRRGEAQRLYRKFVREEIRAGSPWEGIKGQILLGRPRFVEKHQGMLRGGRDMAGSFRARRDASRPPLKRLFSHRALRDREERDRAIYQAHIEHAYTLKEIGDHLGMHFTTVSRAVSRRDPDQ